MASIRQNLISNLKKCVNIGDSKHRDKINMGVKPTESTGKIYNNKSYEVYKNGINRFCDYLENKGIAKSIPYTEARKYCEDFLKHELKTKSPYTVASYKAGLNMVYQNNKITTSINKADSVITKGREVSKSNVRVDKTTQEYKNIKTLAIATGGRRSDLQRLETKDIKMVNGHVYVAFNGSKGGRDRVSHVLPQYEKQVWNLKQQAEEKGDKYILPKNINTAINIHNFRRSYAKQSYNVSCRDTDFRNRLVDFYKIDEKPGSSYITKETSNHEGGLKYDRQSLAIASSGLGHNRLEVIVNNYMK